MTSLNSSDCCVCGHSADAHEHYRRGTDCALCGTVQCSVFRPQGYIAPGAASANSDLTRADRADLARDASSSVRRR